MDPDLLTREEGDGRVFGTQTERGVVVVVVGWLISLAAGCGGGCGNHAE